MAEQSMEDKLVKMLRSLVQQKDARADPPTETGLFRDGEQPPFFKPDELNFETPLDANVGKDLKQKVIGGINGIKNVFRQFSSKIAEFSPESGDLLDYIDAVSVEIFETTDEKDVDLESFFWKIYSSLLQGAIAGTVNEDKPEPEFTLSGNETVDFVYILRKSYYLDVAMEQALEESYFMLSADFESGNLQWCSNLIDYIWSCYLNEYEDMRLAEALSADAMCILHNMEVVHDRLDSMLPEDEGIDANGAVKRMGGKPKPSVLRMLIRLNVAIQHFGEAYWWLGYNYELIMEVKGLYEGSGNYKKKSSSFTNLKKSLDNSRFLKNKARYLQQAKKHQKN